MKRGKTSAASAPETRRRSESPPAEGRQSGTVRRAEVDATQLLRELETRLEEAEEALRESDRHKLDFLAVLSDELRHPIAPLRTSLVVLARTNPTSEEARRARTVMSRQVSRLDGLVDELLEITRIASGRSPLHCEPVHLTSLVRHAVDDQRTAFTAAGIHVRTRIDAAPIWVDGDPARLIQVIGHALSNAKKFTPPGGQLSVTLSTAGDADATPRANLRFRDTGLGIAPGEIGRVFEPFTRGAQSISRSRGLGLGLAMLKGVVTLHHGDVRIESEGIGHGTELTIHLPLRPAAADGTPIGGPRPARCRRVLIIEHHVDAADTLRDVLTLDKHDVRVAYDGPTGLALAHEFRPEIVICDITLGAPEMDGYAVARAIRADASLRSIYLVALSGYPRMEERRRAAVAGFNRHLAKPPSLDALDRVLEEAPAALDIN